MNRFAACGRFRRRSPLEGKKNGGSDPPRGGARSRAPLTGHFPGPAQDRACRSGSHGDGRTFGHAPGGAAALSELLHFPAPANPPHTVACPCGQQAAYRELRSKPLLTAVGRVQISRPYYLCPHCHRGQFPADVELDIEKTEFSPGVRRIQALVGQEAPFDHGREQMHVLAGLEVTTKSVERTAKGLERISLSASNSRSTEPCSWTCPSKSASRFRSYTCKWMGREYRW